MTRKTRPGLSTRPRAEALEGRALLAGAGTPDPGFGGGTGYASISLGVPVSVGSGQTDDFQTKSVITLSNGNIVVSGSITIITGNNTNDTYLNSIAEFNADGSVDTGFGVGGQVTLPADGTNVFQTFALPGGQFLGAEGLTGGGYVAVRFNPNGSIDTGYGVDGVASYASGSATPTAKRINSVVSILPGADGQVLLVGSTSDGIGTVRLDADGSPDATYGLDGTVDAPVMVLVNGTAMYVQAFDAALQANGQVVVAGSYSTGSVFDGQTGYPTSEIAVVRLDVDGTLDATYGDPSAGGIALIPPDLTTPPYNALSLPTGLAVDPTTGKALISGFNQRPDNGSTNANLLVRLNVDGTPDTTFGTGGRIETIFNGPVVVQSDGQVVLTGSSITDSPLGADTALLRLNADGSPDATFGNSSVPGLFLAHVTRASIDVGTALSIQPGGDILRATVGTVPSLSGLINSFQVVKVLPTATNGPAAIPLETLPADFLGQGYTDAAVFDPASSSFVYTPPDGFGGTIQLGIAGVGQTLPAAADYDGSGHVQAAVYLTASGVYVIPSSYTDPGQFLQFGTPGLGQSIPVPADYEGTGKADIAVYLTASGSFAILSSDGIPGRIVQFGSPGLGQSIPVPADYYGIGRDALAVYLPASGAFAIQDPTGQTAGGVIPFGKPGLGQSIPVPGDYDGSGHVELAVYIPSLGAYFYRPFNNGPDVMVPIGSPNSGVEAVPGDYDGSGRTEVAIFDPSVGVLAYKPADGGPIVTISLGAIGKASFGITTPIGSLPPFDGSGSGGGNTRALSISAPAPGLASSSASVTRSSSVPSGPASTSARLPRLPVNQAAPDLGIASGWSLAGR